MTETMTRYKIASPEPRFAGDVAGVVFRAGEADAETPRDLVALTYFKRRGYTVVAVDDEGDPLPEDEQPAADTPDPDATVDSDTDDAVERPADYASKADWVAYAVHRGASEADAQAATKNELIELYG